MSTFAGSIEQLEAALADMGGGMTYPPTPNFAPAVLARVDTAERRPRLLPTLWPMAPRLVITLILALLLLACAAVAAYFLYPVPKGFDLSVDYGHRGADVFVVTAEDMERLVSSPWNDGGATWAPDCSRIAFNSNRPTAGAANNYNIWVMNPDGTDPVKLTDSPDFNVGAQWSPDGTRIAFTRTVLDNEIGPQPPYGWMPPKTQDIYVINADGSGETRLTDGPGLKQITSWSPDGKRMLLNFAQKNTEYEFVDDETWADNETWEIYVMNADGTDMRNLSNRPGKDVNAKWSPDGKLIAFESTRGDGTEDIFVMDADGGNVRRLTDHPANDMLPHWSPDGKWTSFTSFRQGRVGSMSSRADIYMMKADGSEVQHVIQGWGVTGWSTCKAQQ